MKYICEDVNGSAPQGPSCVACSMNHRFAFALCMYMLFIFYLFFECYKKIGKHGSVINSIHKGADYLYNLENTSSICCYALVSFQIIYVIDSSSLQNTNHDPEYVACDANKTEKVIIYPFQSGKLVKWIWKSVVVYCMVMMMVAVSSQQPNGSVNHESIGNKKRRQTLITFYMCIWTHEAQCVFNGEQEKYFLKGYLFSMLQLYIYIYIYIY